MISTPDRFRPDTAEIGPAKRSCLGPAGLSAREGETRALMESGAFPNSVRVFMAPDVPFDLDVLFEFGLARFLDGVGVLIADRSRTG
jgi:hypothetical protein